MIQNIPCNFAYTVLYNSAKTAVLLTGFMHIETAIPFHGQTSSA